MQAGSTDQQRVLPPPHLLLSPLQHVMPVHQQRRRRTVAGPRGRSNKCSALHVCALMEEAMHCFERGQCRRSSTHLMQNLLFSTDAPGMSRTRSSSVLHTCRGKWNRGSEEGLAFSASCTCETPVGWMARRDTAVLCASAWALQWHTMCAGLLRDAPRLLCQVLHPSPPAQRLHDCL